MIWYPKLKVSYTHRGRFRNITVTRKLKSPESKKRYNELSQKLDYGDWFLISHLSDRMLATYFDKWIVVVADVVDK